MTAAHATEWTRPDDDPFASLGQAECEPLRNLSRQLTMAASEARVAYSQGRTPRFEGTFRGFGRYS